MSSAEESASVSNGGTEGAKAPPGTDRKTKVNPPVEKMMGKLKLIAVEADRLLDDYDDYDDDDDDDDLA
jgi:hypothetical protein